MMGGTIIRLVALSSMLGLAVLLGLNWERTTTVDAIRVEGAVFTTQDELRPRLDRIKGLHPDSIPYAQWLAELNALPYVDTTLVRIESDGTVVVRIVEREPIALLSEGRSRQYIDAKGVRLPIRIGNPVSVPLLYGIPDAAEARHVLEFLTLVKDDPLASVSLSEVAWTQKEGIVALSHENGVKLLFGKKDFQNRLSVWNTFYREIILESGIERFNSIDLRFNGQVVTKEMPKPTEPTSS